MYLLEVTKQQICVKYCSSGLYYQLQGSCLTLHKLVVYFQQGHYPTANKSVACPRQDSMSPLRVHSILSVTCNIYTHVHVYTDTNIQYLHVQLIRYIHTYFAYIHTYTYVCLLQLQWDEAVYCIPSCDYLTEQFVPSSGTAAQDARLISRIRLATDAHTHTHTHTHSGVTHPSRELIRHSGCGNQHCWSYG